MSSLTEWIYEVQRKLERAHKKVAAAEYALDDVVQDLGALAGRAAGNPGPEPPRRRRAQRDGRAPASVDSLAVNCRGDDFADVVVNGAVRLLLAPKVAGLLRLLAAPTAHSDDDLVGWKTRGELIAALSPASRRAARPYNLGQLILRLRDALEQAGLDPFLVQVSRRKGARFALKARKTDVIAGE